MNLYLREFVDGTLLMLDQDGKVSSVLLDIEEASVLTDDLESAFAEDIVDDVALLTAA